MIRENTVSSSPVEPAVRRMRIDSVVATVIVLVLALLVGLSIYAQSPPHAEPAEIPASSFSASRALRHLSVIAAKPHPTGSTAHREVRDYLVRELEAIGLQTQVQNSALLNAYLKAPNNGVENILARLKGSGNGNAVLLVAHYDSVDDSFGASDDGSSVATLLETLRTLKAGEQLKNDVIVLFTDAEEQGMLGAQAFVAEHEWARDVYVVLNFEARGNTGPVLMFETSDNNGWLINEFAEAAPFPFAHSLSYEIYRLLPNDTDLSVFKEAGLVGFNFANIDGITHYHSSNDNLGAVDGDTMQHKGSYAVALAKHFGNADLTRTDNKNAVYFDLFGRMLVNYSNVWVIPLTALVCALYFGLLMLGFRKQKLTAQGILWGIVSLVVSLVLAALVSFALGKIVWLIRGAPALQSRLFLLGFIALAVVITSVVYRKLRRGASVESLAVGALMSWLLLMVVITFYTPGGSFLFHWPLLAAMIGVGVMMLLPEDKKTGAMFILGLCALPAIVLWVPVIYQVFIGLTLNWIALTVAQAVLLFGLLVPLSLAIKDSFKRVAIR